MTQQTVEVRRTVVKSSLWFDGEPEGVEALTIDGWTGRATRPRPGYRRVPSASVALAPEAAEAEAQQVAAAEEALISVWA